MSPTAGDRGRSPASYDGRMAMDRDVTTSEGKPKVVVADWEQWFCGCAEVIDEDDCGRPA